MTPHSTIPVDIDGEASHSGGNGACPGDPPAALVALHTELTEKARKIMKAKNHDYRGGSGDPFANFRGSTTFGISPIVGILLRMQDKMMRIKTFSEKGQLKVKGEGVEDAILDIINYAVLVAGMVKETKDGQH